jgi:protoheme IX farnesyltransferase
MQDGITSRLRLAKAGLCLPLSFSSLLGYLLAEPEFSREAILVVAGIFSLASGGATLNSLQEWRLDGQMVRTRNRPLPQGELSGRQAAVQSAVLIVAGFIFLSMLASLWPVVLGIVALLLYNGVYTVLKRRTVFAIFPGAVCGALPPIIGWLAGGGEFLAATAGMLFLLFVLWQIPHFWLVMLRYQQDYSSHDFPSMLNTFSEKRMKRLLLSWVTALGVAMIMISFHSHGPSPLIQGLVVMASFFLVIVFSAQLLVLEQPSYRMLFILFNVIFFFNILLVGSSRVYLSYAWGQ